MSKENQSIWNMIKSNE